MSTSEAAAAIVAAMRADERSRVCAIDHEGVLVTVPASLELPAGSALTPPGHRTTLAHLVDSLDLMRVVEMWESVQVDGVASGVVRLPGNPEQYALAFADARAEHGCYLASLTPLGVTLVGTGSGAQEITRVIEEVRPRTATLRKDSHALITEVGDRAERLLGHPAAAMLGHRSTEFLHPDDVAVALDGWMQMLSTGVGYRSRLRHRRGDGSWLWLEVVQQLAPTADGTLSVVAELTDISTEMAAVEELRRRERLFRRTVEALPVGLLRMDLQGRVVQVNARFGALLGSPAGLAEDASLAARLADCGEDCATRTLAAVQACLTGGDDARVQVTVGGDDWSGAQHCSIDVVPLGDDDGEPGVVLVVQDVTEAVRAQRRLAHRATTDGLTGCLNRSAVLSALDDALATAPTGGEHAPAVIFFDLDGFKSVNDRLGHAVGDALLIRVSEVLREVVAVHPGGAEVSRLGGDEFLVVLHRSEDQQEVEDLARRACETLRENLPRTPQLAGDLHRLPIGSSAGSARAVPGDTAGTLVARADAAMYVAKRAGRRADWSDPGR
ncbi:sensor domain-containing diguanylate cyclase [Kineococcus sp. NBC_00420]|uniref:sensor domain-containing diguanylate cyclase n=1 Tax=Kineococcus sp. NBC_00420 TaxID=2903564 RepID=UPI002E1E2488